MIVGNHWECSLGIQPKVPQRVRFFQLVLLVTRCCDSDLAAFWLHIFSRNSGWLTIPISSWVTCMTWHGILFFVDFPCSKSLRQKRWRPNFKAKMNPISRTTREPVPIAAWKVKHILSGPFHYQVFFGCGEQVLFGFWLFKIDWLPLNFELFQADRCMLHVVLIVSWVCQQQVCCPVSSTKWWPLPSWLVSFFGLTNKVDTPSVTHQLEVYPGRFNCFERLIGDRHKNSWGIYWFWLWPHQPDLTTEFGWLVGSSEKGLAVLIHQSPPELAWNLTGISCKAKARQ